MNEYVGTTSLVNVRVGGTCKYHWTLKVTIMNTFIGTQIIFHAVRLLHSRSPLFSHCDKHTLQLHTMNTPNTITGVLSLR